MKEMYKKEYFAATTDMVELANGMVQGISVWRDYCHSRALIELWRKKLSNYYGVAIAGPSSLTITPGGSEGELAMIKVNDLHSLLQEQLVIITSQRPAGIAKAENGDTKSLKASKIATALAEFYMNMWEGDFVRACEMALLCDESYTELSWNKDLGDPIMIDPETGRPEMTGDSELKVHAPWNVARDPGANIDQQKWKIISFKGNRFDFAARYPEFKEAILIAMDDNLPVVPMNDVPDGSDAMFAHLLIHDRTPAVPDGRYSLMIGEKIVIDMTLPFENYPVDRMASADVIDGCIGYSGSNDIMAAEQATDALNSIALTNLVSFGGATIVAPDGSNIKHSDLAKGLRFFEVNPALIDKIKLLDLAKVPADLFNYISILGQKKERAVGSVQTSLAQQAAQGASGNSMALIQTQAISYNSGTQRNYFRMLSSVMTKNIRNVATFGDTQRIARIAGKNKSAQIKEFKFSGHDLSNISCVTYELVSPMAQSFGGRLTFAQDLLKSGLIQSPEQYITLATTGQIEPLIQGDEARAMRILEENERLLDGSPIMVLVSDNHSDHINSHMAQITSEMIEANDDAIGRITEHTQEHINQWTQATLNNPGILIATKQQPLYPPQSGQPQAEGPAQEKPMQIEGPAPDPAEEPGLGDLPSLPNVAGTDEKPLVPGVNDAGLH